MTSHKQTCIVDTMIYPRETLMGENPNDLSYEDIFRIRTSIHHDQIHQTLLHMRVYTRDTKYLSFHVDHVVVASTLSLSVTLAMEAPSSSSRNTLPSCQIWMSHHGAHTSPRQQQQLAPLSLSITHWNPLSMISYTYPWNYIKHHHNMCAIILGKPYPQCHHHTKKGVHKQDFYQVALSLWISNQAIGSKPQIICIIL